MIWLYQNSMKINLLNKIEKPKELYKLDITFMQGDGDSYHYKSFIGTESYILSLITVFNLADKVRFDDYAIKKLVKHLVKSEFNFKTLDSDLLDEGDYEDYLYDLIPSNEYELFSVEETKVFYFNQYGEEFACELIE